MKFCYSRTATAVLCALAAGTAGAADQDQTETERLDTINVEGEVINPSIEPLSSPPSLAPGRDSGDALRDLIGVSGSRMGGHGVDPTVRGLSQTRINVLLDGAYVHGGCPNRMDPPTSYASTGNYEEIIVLKGTRTLEYGGGGPGGTILFERRTERFDGDEKVRGRVDAGYRGNGGTWDVGADVAGGADKGFLRFIGSYTDAGNYDDGNGDEVRSSYEQSSGTLILGYTPSDMTRAELSFERQETRDLLFPGAGMDSPYADNDTFRLKIESEEVGGAFTRVKFDAYRSEVEHEMDNYTLRPFTAMAKMRAPSTSDTTGGRLVANLTSGYGQWKIGVDKQDNARDAVRINDSAGTLNSVLWPGVDIDQTGVFAELTHHLDARNRITGGLRYDHVTSDASKADVNPPPPNPMMPMMNPRSPNELYALYYNGAQADKETNNNVGGLLHFEHDLETVNGTVFAGVSRSVRTPDASERFLASNGSMTVPAWVGNPEIDPEKHHQVELGISLRGVRWDAQGSIYYNDVDDFILRDREVAMMGPNPSIYRNIDATLYGGEVMVGYRWSENWRSDFGLGYVRARNDTDDRHIAQTPPLEGVVSLDYSSGNWDAGARVRAADKQTRVDTTSSTGVEGEGLDVQETPGWGVLDLYGRYALNDNVSIDVGVDNVFDKNYPQHLNRANAFDPTQVQVNEPGRSAWLKVKATF